MVPLAHLQREVESVELHAQRQVVSMDTSVAELDVTEERLACILDPGQVRSWVRVRRPRQACGEVLGAGKVLLGRAVATGDDEGDRTR